MKIGFNHKPVITLSRAREEMYTCSAVSTAGASVGGPWGKRARFVNSVQKKQQELRLMEKSKLMYKSKLLSITILYPFHLWAASFMGLT